MFVYSHDILTIYSEKYIVRIDIKFLKYEISVRKNYNNFIMNLLTFNKFMIKSIFNRYTLGYNTCEYYDFIQKYICENIECPDLNFVGF